MSTRQTDRKSNWNEVEKRRRDIHVSDLIDNRLPADDLSSTFLAQDTRLLRLRTPVTALLPAEERQHATVLPLPPSLV